MEKLICFQGLSLKHAQYMLASYVFQSKGVIREALDPSSPVKDISIQRSLSGQRRSVNHIQSIQPRKPQFSVPKPSSPIVKEKSSYGQNQPSKSDNSSSPKSRQLSMPSNEQMPNFQIENITDDHRSPNCSPTFRTAKSIEELSKEQTPTNRSQSLQFEQPDVEDLHDSIFYIGGAEDTADRLKTMSPSLRLSPASDRENSNHFKGTPEQGSSRKSSIIQLDMPTTSDKEGDVPDEKPTSLQDTTKDVVQEKTEQTNNTDNTLHDTYASRTSDIDIGDRRLQPTETADNPKDIPNETADDLNNIHRETADDPDDPNNIPHTITSP